MVTLNHTKEGVADEFLADCREVVQNIVANPSSKATGAVGENNFVNQLVQTIIRFGTKIRIR